MLVLGSLTVPVGCVEETEIHVSIESWIGSYKAQFEQMNRNFPESAAFDLGSLGSLVWKF